MSKRRKTNTNDTTEHHDKICADGAKNAAAGNTESGCKKARHYMFTLNNYDDAEIKEILTFLDDESKRYIFQEELGEENKTPHLQGYIEFKNERYLNAMKNRIKRWNVRICKKPKNAQAYACKENTRNGKIWAKGIELPKPKNREIILKRLEETIWYKWQEYVIEFVKTKPDDRKIMWIEDILGCIGKSLLAKYLFLKYDAIIADGKKIDVFNQTLKWLEEKSHEKSPHLVILDIPRHNADYVNYGLLEKLKDGLIYSGKYEGGACVFDSPHIIIFANFEPCFDKFTEDRWIHITPTAEKDWAPTLRSN